MSIPYVPQGTSKRFRVPRTLAADFDRFLEQDIPNTNMDFELLHNWYDQFKDDYEANYIRGEIYPDSTKSRYENTDNNMNIRCSRTSGIRKGDMIIDPYNQVYLLDWNVHLEANNAPSRAVHCNLMLNIKRYKDAEVDDNGYVIDENGFVVSAETFDQGNEGKYEIVVNRLPANAWRYDGRPEYTTVSGAPGAIPNALTLVSVQFNHKTKNIRIGDIFEWGDQTYEIVDINRVGIDIFEHYGTLKIQAKKKAGGLRDYD